MAEAPEKNAGKLVFHALFGLPFWRCQKGNSAAGPRAGAASPENKPRAKQSNKKSAAAPAAQGASPNVHLLAVPPSGYATIAG